MKQFDIYTDGSHLDKQNNGRLGIGGVLIDPTGPGMGTMLNKFSIELTPEYMNLSFGAQKCSNPSAELVAVLHALYEFRGSWGPNDIVVVHADYLGVRARGLDALDKAGVVGLEPVLVHLRDAVDA